MLISESLVNLAEKLKEQADEVLAKAEHSPAMFAYAADVIAAALHDLELGAALIDDVELTVTPDMLETVAGLAEALDETGDDSLISRASVLDDLLVTISAPKSSVAKAAAATEDEINELRNKYRAQRIGELYSNPQKVLNEQINHEQIAKAVKNQVKEYRPLEGPLMTRYCPDHNGQSMMRIADRVFQCQLDRKVYNFEAGYTTEKGNKIPGGGVENQVPDWGHREIGHTVFDSRQSSMSRFASGNITKIASGAPKYTVKMHNGTKALDIIVPPGTTDEQKKIIEREVAGTYGQMAMWWHEAKDEANASDGLPKHTVSLPTGSHELLITVPPGTNDSQKAQIQQSIVNTYGNQYTIKWNESLVNQASVKTASEELPFELNEEEGNALAYIADRYDSARILYDNLDSEKHTIPAHAVLEAFEATKGDGGNLGTVPLAGGTLADKIMKLFDEVNAWEMHDANSEFSDESFEDEEVNKVEAMANLFSKFAG